MMPVFEINVMRLGLMVGCTNAGRLINTCFRFECFSYTYPRDRSDTAKANQRLKDFASTMTLPSIHATNGIKGASVYSGY